MRVVGRIFFAILAVFAFWFTIDYARGRMSYLYFQDEGTKALAYSDDAFFYGSGRDYSYQTSLFTAEDSRFRIAFYETADTTINEDTNELTVSPYINAVFIDRDGVDGYYRIVFSNEIDSLELSIIQFQVLDIAMLCNVGGTEYGINEIDLLNSNFTSFTIYDGNENLLWTQAFSITNDQLVIEDKLRDYYNTNEELPLDQLVSDQIYPKYTHTLEPYVHVMYISLVVYVLVLAGSFYIVFVFRKKFMGKKEPSVYFKKEQQRYQKKNDES